MCRYWTDIGRDCITANITDLCQSLVDALAHNETSIRTAAAEALAAALSDHQHQIPSTLDLVLDLYSEHLKVTFSVIFID